MATATAPGAHAIVNGRPDGNDHPDAGMLAVEQDGVRLAWCSGWYAGPRTGDPGTGVFVTAGHCLADVAEQGFEASDIAVTFASNAHYDMDRFEAVAGSWHPAFAYDFRLSGADDYGVVLLEDPVPGLAGLKFPAARLLDTRSFSSLSEAIDEIVEVRIWSGIHFRTADEQGARMGRKIASYRQGRYFRTAHGRH